MTVAQPRLDEAILASRSQLTDPPQPPTQNRDRNLATSDWFNSQFDNAEILMRSLQLALAMVVTQQHAARKNGSYGSRNLAKPDRL